MQSALSSWVSCSSSCSGWIVSLTLSLCFVQRVSFNVYNENALANPWLGFYGVETLEVCQDSQFIPCNHRHLLVTLKEFLGTLQHRLWCLKILRCPQNLSLFCRKGKSTGSCTPIAGIICPISRQTK